MKEFQSHLTKNDIHFFNTRLVHVSASDTIAWATDLMKKQVACLYDGSQESRVLLDLVLRQRQTMDIIVSEPLQDEAVSKRQLTRMQKEYPHIRILRMPKDTLKSPFDYHAVLSPFRNKEERSDVVLERKDPDECLMIYPLHNWKTTDIEDYFLT